ncbi:AMP-binding protein [Sneathiella sp. CAU 1612]|uniref:AMP-binding protein n=1 Tax=Sneathiella sedimenti TaxID=2816034 RepID=A0ABS3F4P5_9PROT|nr:acyl--CoA ligase [Sneathiella sedimenti]MBO0333308.1 AMP-binding protein [Sneathiella sedimenti]
MTDATTMLDLINAGAGEDAAIGAPERNALSYAALRELSANVIETLNSLGIGRGDRVAIVLPNGPEMASAFVTVACAATTAPLNPDYKAEEFEFYLEDLKAKALIVEKGSKSPAVDVAKKLGVSLIELTVPENAPAGLIELVGAPVGDAGSPGKAEAEDIALILHTSGTTSRPKIVPLSHRNVTASARNIAHSLALTPTDKCLNIMPLFHIHGLIAAVLSSLKAGASVTCTPGFNALKVFGWIDEEKPSWYTAVPTMHQAILARGARNEAIVKAAKLRFIRSSSASLPPQVMAALEEMWHCPVIEAYGMTEASHQMAANPLPPARRIPGSVGIASGPEVAIMSEDGLLLKAGETGEIVIRGENVTTGYENNPKANAEAFTNGWFRTGDQGIMSADGYLSLTGRLKEIINRGGEKISPREVDEVLMNHPAVEQVVTFALPHEKLGEEVAAAIVLRDGQQATEAELRDFAAKSLAAFKVPRSITLLDEIPKGATGKLQRIGLAEKLGLA